MKKLSKKIFSLLTLKEKKGAFVIFIFLIIGMFLETLGISLVIPFMAIMIEDDIAFKYPFILPLLNFLDNPSKQFLLFIGVGFILIIYLLKNLFLGVSVFIQQRYVYSIQVNLSKRLFFLYLNQPYHFHLKFNSAELQHNVVNKVAAFSGTITQLMYFIAELLIIFGLIVLLFIVEPTTLLIALTIFLPPAVIFSLIMRNRVSKWGKEVNIYETQKILHVNQGFGAIKDIILKNRQDYFTNKYNDFSLASAKISASISTLSQLPRFAFEFLAIISMTVIIMLLVMRVEDLNQIIPLLAVFAAAAFRMMPSFNRLVSSYQNIRYMTPVVDTIFYEFARKPEKILKFNTPSELSFKEIKFENVFFKYISSENFIINNLNFTIEKNKTIGLIGPTGSGKSTLINMICGLLEPTKGKILLNGEDLINCKSQLQNQIGYIPQSIYLSDDTISNNITIGLARDEVDEANLIEAIDSSELREFVNSLDQGIDTYVGERGARISGGQLQRLGIARALYSNPKILILDEATSSLDIKTEKKIMDSIYRLKGKKTIIIIAHRYSAIEHCDTIYKIENGTISKQGTPKEVL